MKEFWDSRADEDAFYFVDNQLRYREPDQERFWANGRTALDRILGWLGVSIEADDDVVEVGCGLGRITRVLAERGATVRAIDISERMLAQARDLNSGLDNVTWLLGDGTTLAAVEDVSADVCFSDVVFQHIPDPAITLGYVREMGRVLRPGGWAAFQISNDPDLHRRRPLHQRLATGVRAAVGRGPRGQSDPAWLGSPIKLEELGRAAAEGGLTVERTVGEGTQFCYVLARAAG